MTTPDTSPARTDGLAAVSRLRDAMNAHDAHAVAACFTTDYRCDFPLHPSRGFTGSDQVLRNWVELLDRFPELATEVLRTATHGDETWTEWEHAGTDAAGDRTTFRGVVILTTRDGLIDRARFYLDVVAADGS